MLEQSHLLTVLGKPGRSYGSYGSLSVAGYAVAPDTDKQQMLGGWS